MLQHKGVILFRLKRREPRYYPEKLFCVEVMRRPRASSAVEQPSSAASVPPPTPARSTDSTPSWLGVAAIVALTAVAATTTVVEAAPFQQASLLALGPRRKATQDVQIEIALPTIRQRRRGIGRHRPTFLVTIPRGGHADFFDDGMYSDSSDGDDRGGSGDQNQNTDGAQNGQQQPSDANNQWGQHAQDQLQNYQEYGYDSHQQQQQQLAQAQAEAAQAAYLSRVASTSRMNARTASLALRLTVEINQKLRRGTEAPSAYCNSNDDSLRHLHMDLVDGGEASEPPPPPPPPTPQPQNHQSSWQMQPFRQNAQEPQNQDEHEWKPKIRRPNAESGGTHYSRNQHTIFHADRPRDRSVTESLTGVKRWGVDLQQYIEKICRAMKCSEEDMPLVLARALIYLDRACNVETERNFGYQNEASLPCPPLLPQTVHRLLLAAMVLSCRVGRGQGGIEYDGAYCEISTQFGVASNSLATMEAVMRDALGMEGLWIDFYKLVHYLSAWRETFTEEGAMGGPFSENSDVSITDVSQSDELDQPKPPSDDEDIDDIIDE